MADLWVLMPSRGRPASVERAVRTYAQTCQSDTRIHFGFDGDDPDLEASVAATGGHRYTVQPGRHGLVWWTNNLAARHVKRGDARALGSFGDDHVPVTHGWDMLLLDAIERDSGGIGMSYPNDKLRTDIPEAVVVSAAIVKALGWMALPVCDHWYIDNAWRDLGAGAGCLTFCHDVIVEHRRHEKWTKLREVLYDNTYADAWPQLSPDGNAYRRWRLKGMRADIKTIRELRESCLNLRG